MKHCRYVEFWSALYTFVIFELDFFLSCDPSKGLHFTSEQINAKFFKHFPAEKSMRQNILNYQAICNSRIHTRHKDNITNKRFARLNADLCKDSKRKFKSDSLRFNLARLEIYNSCLFILVNLMLYQTQRQVFKKS